MTRFAIVLQVAGLALLAAAAFTVSIGLGLAVSGAAAFASGVVIEREQRRTREP